MNMKAAVSIVIYEIDPHLCDSYVICTRYLKYQDPQDLPHMHSTLNNHKGSSLDRYLCDLSLPMWFLHTWP